jgi:hypothetical protein
MSVFQSNTAIGTYSAQPVPSDSQVPGIGRGGAQPKLIRSDSFLNGGDLKSAVDQAIFHGNGSVVVPLLNENISGSANLTLEKDRYEEVKGVTNSVQLGGVAGTYGENLVKGGPFTNFTLSSVYEGHVSSQNFAPQSEHTAEISDSVEFGDRSIARYDYEVRTIYGNQSSYAYGTTHTNFKGAAAEDIVVGTKHDTYDQVTSFQAVVPLNILIGAGLHLQCRPGMELNYNIWNVVVAISESLVGLVNLDFIVARLAGKPVSYGLSGVRLSADAANIRQVLGIPLGNMRIP